MSDFLPSHDQRNWEKADPIGVFRPLSSRLVAGQTASSGQLLQPLGVRSLTVLQPRLFLSGAQELSPQPTSPFAASPFFDTTARRSPSLPLPATSALPSPPETLESASLGPNLPFMSSTVSPVELTEPTAPAAPTSTPVSPNQEVAAVPPFNVQLSPAESVAATDDSAATVYPSISETDATARAPEPPAAAAGNVAGPTSPVEPVTSPSASPEVLSEVPTVDLPTPSAAEADDRPSPVAEPLVEPQPSAIQRSSATKVDSTVVEPPTPQPLATSPAELATSAQERGQRSPHSPEPADQLPRSTVAPEEAEVQSAPIEPVDEPIGERSPLPPNETDIAISDATPLDESPSVAPAPVASSAPRTTASPTPVQRQPLEETFEEQPVEPNLVGETPNIEIPNEVPQASPLPNQLDGQLSSVDPATPARVDRCPEVAPADLPAPTDSVRPSSAETSAAASDALITESQHPAPNLQRQPDGGDHPVSFDSTDISTVPPAAAPTDRSVPSSTASRLSAANDTASPPAADLPDSSSPETLARQEALPFPVEEREPSLMPPSPIERQLAATPDSAGGIDSDPPTSATRADLDSASARVAESVSESTEIQRSPNPSSSSSSFNPSRLTPPSTPTSPSEPAAIAASVTPSESVANPSEAAATPSSGPSTALPNAIADTVSEVATSAGDRPPPVQRRATIDAPSVSDDPAPDLSATAIDRSSADQLPTEPTATVTAETAAESPSAEASMSHAVAAEPSSSLQQSSTASAAQDSAIASQAPPTAAETAAAANTAASDSPSSPISPASPPSTDATEAVSLSLQAKPTALPDRQPEAVAAATAEDITTLEESSDPVQHQPATTSDIDDGDLSVAAEPRSPAPDSATPLQPASLGSSLSADPASEPITPSPTANSTRDVNAAAGTPVASEATLSPNQLPPPEASIQPTHQETDIPGAMASSSSVYVSEVSSETVISAKSSGAETVESPVSDREAAVQRDANSLVLPVELSPETPADPVEQVATQSDPSTTTSDPSAKLPTPLPLAAASTDTTIAAEPTTGESAKEAKDVSQPFLAGDEAIQRAIALPTVLTDLSHQMPQRSPSGLLSSASESPVPELSQPVRELTDEPTAPATVNESAPTTRQTLSQRAERRLPTPAGDSAVSPASSQSAGLTSPAIPQAWDSVEDLLSQPSPSASDLQTSSSVQRASVAAAPTSTFPNLQAAAIPVPVVQRHSSAKTDEPVQRLTTDAPNPDSTTSEYGVPETDEPAAGTSENLEKLAAVMYQMVRQRLAIQRERLGRSGSGRF